MTTLYVDIDGVIFGIYGGVYQIRPFTGSFLEWANRHFNVSFLTAWPEKDVDKLIDSLCSRHSFSYTEWKHDKTEAIQRINCDKDFIWIDDDPSIKDLKWLKESECEDRIVLVNPKGINGLNDAVVKICDIAKIEYPEFVIDFDR